VTTLKTIKQLVWRIIMKKFIKFALAAVCTCAVSFSSFARIPADGDCDAWLDLLNRCEANPGGFYYGYTCSELYYTWQDCRNDNGNWLTVVGKEND
jgi:hypothetical protein